MTEDMAVLEKVDAFLGDWDKEPMHDAFARLFRCVATMPDVELQFVSREKVSHSVRVRHVVQKERNLFGMIDVIDDNPEERWLSVCFYGDLITDPEERGEVIPGGLGGEDGYCFDMYQAEEDVIVYIIERLTEAWENAAQS